MGRDFYICFVCPFCFRSRWMFRRNVEMTRDGILNSYWAFECPVHGLQVEKPLQANPREVFQEETVE